MPTNIIQWFPGHMAVARRLIKESLRDVDIVFEILDARIPLSSRNPEIKKILSEKPSIILLNKSDLSDPELNRQWIDKYKNENTGVLETDCKSGKGLEKIQPLVSEMLSEKLARYKEKNMTKRIRAMVVGIPNGGKSSLINRMCGAKKAQVENRPGVTRQKQWVRASNWLELLDMPGVLWPRFDDRVTGENLAITGAIKDNVLEAEEIAVILCGRLRRFYPALLSERYKIKPEELVEDDNELFETIGRKRGMLASGGSVNRERCALMLLDEFRSGKIGRITLEVPDK